MIIHRDINTVLRIEIGDQTYALRIPRLSESLLQIDRHSECTIAHTAAQARLGPEVLTCEPETGVLITRWIHHAPWTPEQARTSERITDLASTLQRLHSLPIPSGVRTLDLQTHLDAYWTSAQSHSNLPPQLANLRTRAQTLLASRRPGRPCLCHNDLHARNILGVGDDLRLLDWEYAAIGHALFDLASFAQSNELTGSQRTELLDAYGVAPDERRQFAHECWLFDWTSTLWLLASEEHRTPSGQAALNALIERLTM